MKKSFDVSDLDRILNGRNNISLLPDEGNAKDFFERFSRYVEQLYLGWKKNIKGVSEEKIQQLLKVSGVNKNGYTLPEEYLIYLRMMGKYDGDIMFISDLSFNLDTVLMVYDWFEEEDVEKNYQDSPFQIIAYNEICENAIVLDKRNNHIYNSEYYDCLTENNQEYISNQYFSESFEKMLFQQVLDIYLYDQIKEKLKFINIDSFSDYQSAYKHVDNVCQKYNFKKCWLSDDINYIADNGINTIYITGSHGYIIGSDPDQVIDFYIQLYKEINLNAYEKELSNTLYYASKELFRRLNIDEGIIHIDRSIEVYPNSENLCFRADKYFEMSQYDDAINAYKRAIELEEDEDKKADIILDLVPCLRGKKDYNQAKEYLMTVIEERYSDLDEDNLIEKQNTLFFGYMYNAVRIFTDCGEYEKAEFYMDIVRRTKKEITQNDCLTSMYLWEKLGKYVEAMDNNRKLINTSDYYLWMATHYWLAGDMENKDLYYSTYSNYIMHEADYESLIPKYTSDRKKKYEEVRNYYIANMYMRYISKSFLENDYDAMKKYFYKLNALEDYNMDNATEDDIEEGNVNYYDKTLKSTTFEKIQELMDTDARITVLAMYFAGLHKEYDMINRCLKLYYDARKDKAEYRKVMRQYYAKDYLFYAYRCMAYGNIDEAIEMLEGHIDARRCTYPSEYDFSLGMSGIKCKTTCCYSCCIAIHELLGIIYEIKGDKYKALEHYTVASKENPLGLFHCLRKKALEEELSL